jgi:hypothetical protein
MVFGSEALCISADQNGIRLFLAEKSVHGCIRLIGPCFGDVRYLCPVALALIF